MSSTGTILETHAVLFYEERFAAIGPLGRFCDDECYPQNMRPSSNADRYPAGDTPSEQAFDLEQPGSLRDKRPDLNYDDIKLPTLEEIMREPSVPPAPRPKREGEPGIEPPRKSPSETEPLPPAEPPEPQPPRPRDASTGATSLTVEPQSNDVLGDAPRESQSAAASRTSRFLRLFKVSQPLARSSPRDER